MTEQRDDDTNATPGPDAASAEAAPADATPVDAAPVDAAPVDAAPVDAAPVDAAPVDAAPVDAAPVDAAPVDAAPVDAAPVDAAPVDAAPVDAAPDGAASGAEPFVIEEWMLDAVEALVFASAEPLAPGRVREVLGAELAVMESHQGKAEPSLADVQQIFRSLLERWGDPTRPTGRGFRLVEIDGGLCFRTVAAQARFIRRMQMGKPQRLSRAALETLAVVAYRQPVTKPQIEEVRGVDSSGAVKALLDKKLIRIIGKAEEIGRPLLYGTTRTFLEFFELQSLTDLPTLKELHELDHGGAEPAAPGDDRPAVIMDLFNANQVSAVSEETERESSDALSALEQALGQAKDVAKRASSLVFGMEVEDAEDGGAPQSAQRSTSDNPDPAAPAAPPKGADEEPEA